MRKLRGFFFLEAPRLTWLLRTLVGNPISQVILEKCGPKALVAFLAALLGSSLFAGLALRWLCHGRRWAWADKI